MPDITNRIGIDSIDQNILLQSSQDRFNKLFSDMGQPQFADPNAAFAPLKSFKGSEGSQYDPNLDTFVGTGDPTVDMQIKEARAIQATHRLLSVTNPVYYKGLGENKYLPYEPLKKYLDEDFGFKPSPELTLGDQITQNDDAYANIKNTVFRSIGKFLGRTLMGAAAKTVQGASYMMGLTTGWMNPAAWYDMLVNDEDYLTAAGDNVLSQAMEHVDQEWKNDWMPVYQEASSRGQGFWHRILNDGSFWQNEISDGAAFALSSFIPTLAISKVGLGARAVSGLSKMGASSILGAENTVLGSRGMASASKYLQNAKNISNFVDKSAVTIANTMSESYFESRETYDAIYNKLIDQGVSEPVARERAQSAAKGTFWANMPALLFSNAFETKLMFKAMGLNKVGDQVAQGIRRESGAFGKFLVDSPTTRLGKYMASPLGFYAKRLPEAILKEGYWEENIQQAIQRYYANPDNTKEGIYSQITGILKNQVNQAIQATMGNDPESAISIGLGGFIGSGQSIISSAIAKEYASNKAFRDKTVTELNQLQDNWLKYGDPYERDSNGNILLEDVEKEDGTKEKRPKVSIPRLLAYTIQVNKMSEHLALSDDIKNEVINGFVKDSLFAELAIANINADTLDSFKDNLRRSKNYSEEDLAKIGLQKDENYNTEVDRKLKLIDSIEKLNNSLNDDILFKSVNDRKDVEIEKQRRSELLRNGTTQIILQDSIRKSQAELDTLRLSIEQKYDTKETDYIVEKLNEFNKKIKYYENSLKEFKNSGVIDGEFLETTQKLLADITSLRDEYIKDSPEIVNKLKRNADGIYIYEDASKERDPEVIKFKKTQDRIAQLINTQKVLNEDWYRVADIRTGLSYFKSKLEKKEKVQEEALSEEVAKAEKEKKTEEVNINPFVKYKELQKGDYNKVSALASKIVFGEKAITDDEINIQAAYSDLINELVPLYAQKAKEIRKTQLETKINYLEGLRNDAIQKIMAATNKIGNLSAEADKLIADYKSGNTDLSKARIKKIVKKIQDDIYTLETYIEKNEPKITEIDAKIELLLESLESDPSITSLIDLKKGIDKERAWLSDEISKTKNLIATLKKLLKELVEIAKSLFTGFDPISGKPRSTYEENLDKSRHEASGFESEILSEGLKLQALKNKLGELQEEYDTLEPRLADIELQLSTFKRDFNIFTSHLKNEAFTAQQKQATVKPQYTEEEKALNKIIQEEVPPNNTNTLYVDSKDYDGEGYMRDLNYVFFTSTDPNYDQANDRVRNHHEFLNTIAQLDTKEIREKLKDGKLEVLMITGDNMNSFNLAGLVDPQYLDTNKIAETGIYMTYVLSTKEGHFFIDKDLNIIDKVGELKDTNKERVVFSSLRSGKWREGEKERYDIKYPAGATDKAIINALNFRKDIIEQSRAVNPNNIITYRYAISRGIQNKMESADSQPIKNPVSSTLIKEEDIKPEILSVPTVKDNKDFETRIINGIPQKLPIGRPYLVTNNSKHAQYHYLNNNLLTDEQKQAVKMTLYRLAKDMSETIDRELIKMNNNVPLQKDSPAYLVKIGELARRRKELGINFINLDYINFLKGVLYFRTLDESLPVSAANERQIWLRGDRIVFGNGGDMLYLDDPESFLNSRELDNFLNVYHHNFNSLQEDQKGREFIEFYIKDDKLERRTWTTYSHYMLSAKLPDGTTRADIPLTTTIKTREQAEAEATHSGVYFPYIQRGSTVITENAEKVQKNREIITTNNPSPVAQSGFAFIRDLIKKGEEAKASQTQTAVQPATQAGQVQQGESKPSGMDLIAKLMGAAPQTTAQPKVEINPVTGKESKTTSIEPVDKDSAADMMNFDGNLRVVKGSSIVPEENIEAAKKEVLRMLPQFDVKILDNVIETVLGRQAWGQFTGSAILVYNQAEEGTLYHEAFEALVNSILSDKEWNSLYNEFKSRAGTFTDRETGNTIDYNKATEYQAKEELAEEFRDYKLSGKVWSGEKVKMSFFKRLLKFLEDLIFNLGGIEDVFSKLNKGIYAKTPIRLTTRFSNNYRLIKDIPEVYYHKFIQGATAVMFRDVFLSNRSFTDFDTNIDEDTLYSKLRTDLRKRYDNYLQTAIAMPEGNATRNAIVSAYEMWVKIDNRWKEFTQDHKAFLRPFKIEFIESNDELSEDEDKDNSEKNQNDYARDIFTIDSKKTASTSTRLLFATLVNAQFKSRKGEFFVDEKGMPIIESPVNLVFLPEIANYDETVKTVFNELAGLNNISRIEERLRRISGIEDVMSSNNPKAVIATLDNKQAVLVNLYNRVFGDVKEHDEETKWKMTVKVNNFLAKQAPNPELMIVNDMGNAYFIESNSKEAFETIRKKVNTHIRQMQGKNFARIVSDGEVYFQTPKVTIPDLTTHSEFIRIVTGWFDLKDEFTPEFLNSITNTEFENLSNELRKILAVISDNNLKQNIRTLSLAGLGIESRVKDLLRFYIRKTSSGTDLSYLGVNNQSKQNYVLNNYMSRILADVNYNKTVEELYVDNPHLASIFASDSIVMSRLYENGKRTKNPAVLGYMEGFKQSVSREGQKNSTLGYADRLLLAFNANLRGVYYTLLPADSETEWSINLGDFVQFSNDFETSKKKEVLDIFTRYLETEIKVAQEDILGNLQAMNSKYSDGVRVGDTLRIFRNILKPDNDLLKDIEAGIKDGTAAADITARNKARISNAILNYINATSRKKLNLFINEGIVEQDGIDYRFNLLYDKFADSIGKAKTKENGYYFTEDQIMDVMKYHTVNYFIANTEMFKLFFGDPAQYKDLTKRLKSFTSGVEWTYNEANEESGEAGLNGFLNNSKNNAEYINDSGDKISASIPAQDMFHYKFQNHMNLLVTSDLNVVDTELYNQLVDENFKTLVGNLVKVADAYANINEADAQSITDIQTYREIMIKSGWRWTDKHEEQYQYEIAYGRSALAKKNKYKYSSSELEAIDKAILEKYPTPPTIAAFTPIKPLHAGVDSDNKYSMSLVKTSIYPITYRLAESRELEDLYLKMLQGVDSQRVNIFTFESSHKVGLKLDNDSKITSLYDETKIGAQSDFTKKGTPIEKLPYKHFGIQVETQGDKTGNTLGTQMTKDIKLNLFSDGAPVDYLLGDISQEEAAAQFEKMSISDKKIYHANYMTKLQAFYNMTEGDKIKNSKFYELYKEHETALIDLKTAGYNELLLRIGATEKYLPSGEIEYEYKDLTKVHRIITDEMLRRELDENTIDSVQLREDLQAFKRAPESMPSYDIMRNILYALVDKAILSPKVNGKPYIQVASTFFNLGKRKASTFDKESNQWIELSTEREYNQATKAKKKVVYTSSELGFYKLNKDGTEVQAMEIMLPHIYKQEINEARERRGLPPLSDNEIIKYLEEQQPKLLEGIGFRIPTQATSSIEFFKIKGFLPETFGTAVVVPSAITVKSGSDFDVDKLNTYLNNWFLDGKGMPRYVEYMDDSNSTIQQRYNQFIKNKYIAVLSPVRRAIANLNEKQRKNNKAVRKLEYDLSLFEDLFNDNTKNAEAKLIATIFQTSIRDMQQAMRVDEDLRKLEIEGENLNQLLDNASKEYEEVLKKVQAEMPIEVFASLPTSSQNSKQAVENRYFESIRNILSLPYNFQFLLSPNSNENIIENRNAILKAEDRQLKSKDIDHSQFVDFEYMSQQRHYFVKGKRDIGIFAVAMTNYANSQITGLVISPITDIRKENEFHLADLNAGSFKLPFNYNTIVINGVEHISLSSRFDVDMQSIMDKISGYINGAVDVAKDPIIMDMGMLSELASVYILLERIGVPGTTVALFMKQPIIRDYIREIQLRKSAMSKRSKYNNNKEIIIGSANTQGLITNKYSTGESYKYEDIQLTNEDMSRMLGKAAKAKTRQLIGKDFTKKELRMQQLILANYLKIKIYADHLLETVQSSNHDTTNIRNNHIITRKNWQAQDVKRGNVIRSIADFGSARDGSSAIKAKTFVGNDVDILNRLEKLYGANIFTLQRDNPSRLIKYLGRKIYYATRYQPVIEFEKGMRQLEVQILDYLANNANILGIPSKVTIKNLSDRLFLTSIIQNGSIIRNNQSLHAMYDELMKQIRNTPQHPLSDNLFLNLISFEQDDRAGITTFELKVKPSANDVYTKNRITESIRLLMENENSRRFAKYLVLASIIQNGVGFSRSSINNLIPNEEYGAQISEGLKTIDSQDFTSFEEILARTNLDHSIVGDPNPRQIFYLDPENRVTGISKTEPYLENPNMYNRNFFGKNPVPPAIFIYAGKEDLNGRLLTDYIVIESIHPDYILGPEDGPYTNKVSPEIKEMASKRDFSFIQRTLFKKVGLTAGKVLYVENQTKGKGVNLMAMYKPINHWGSDNFNEIRNVYKDVNGEFTGEASILRDKRKIQEQTDVDIAILIDNIGIGARVKIAEDPTNFKNEYTLNVEKENNIVSLPESDVSQEEINKVIDKFDEECGK